MAALKPTTPTPVARKKKNGADVSNAVKVDAKNPIPFEHNGSTVFSFVNGTQYLPFLPPQDNFGQLLLEARLLSTTNNACVTKKAEYCTGIGLRDTSGKEIDQTILGWFNSLNRKNENVNDLNLKIFEDLFTYGNVPIEIVRFTVAGKKHLLVYVHNFLEWRLGKPDEDDIVNYAIQSKLFYRKGFLTPDEIKKAKRLPIYNPLNSDKANWFKDEQGVERTLIWLKNSVTGFPHYGMPSNLASMIFQILEYKGARYDLDNFDNNMVIGGILALKGNLGQLEANRIGKEIINSHTGDGKRGRVAVIASEEGIEKSDFHDYDTTKDGSYIEADNKWTQKIILANDWDAVLAGIVSPSTLGKGSGFITKIHEIKLNTTIRPAQTKLMEKVWSHVFLLAEEWMGLRLSDYKFEIKNSIDISGLTDVDITPAVQINEVRIAKGLPEDPAKKGVYMKEPKAAAPEKEGEDVPD